MLLFGVHIQAAIFVAVIGIHYIFEFGGQRIPGRITYYNLHYNPHTINYIVAKEPPQLQQSLAWPCELVLGGANLNLIEREKWSGEGNLHEGIYMEPYNDDHCVPSGSLEHPPAGVRAVPESSSQRPQSFPVQSSLDTSPRQNKTSSSPSSSSAVKQRGEITKSSGIPTAKSAQLTEIQGRINNQSEGAAFSTMDTSATASASTPGAERADGRSRSPLGDAVNTPARRAQGDGSTPMTGEKFAQSNARPAWIEELMETNLKNLRSELHLATQTFEASVNPRFESLEKTIVEVRGNQEQMQASVDQNNKKVMDELEKMRQRQDDLEEAIQHVESEQQRNGSECSFGGGKGAGGGLGFRFDTTGTAGHNTTTKHGVGQQRNPYALRKFIMGGPKNAPAEAVIRKFKHIVEAAGSSVVPPVVFQAASMETSKPRCSYLFFEMRPVNWYSSEQVGWEIKKQVDNNVYELPCGGRFWIQPVRSADNQANVKTINKARKFLHQERELAGIPDTYVDQGVTLKTVNGSYKPGHETIMFRTDLVANLDQNHTIVWQQTGCDAAFANFVGYNFQAFTTKWQQFLIASPGNTAGGAGSASNMQHAPPGAAPMQVN